MLKVEKPAGMKAHIDRQIGHSDWVTVDQAMIDRFADAAGGDQGIHIDVERAKREMPGGKTIAHGFPTASLLAGLADQVYEIRQRSRGINYGSNRMRFTAPVQVGSRFLLHRTLKNVENLEGGVPVTFETTMEAEGSAGPALVAQTLNRAYD